MLHVFMDQGPWFRARRFGYGAGLPFKWQGWAVVGCYVLMLVATGVIAQQKSAILSATSFAVMLVVTALFTAICRKRTEGGWKWRWGNQT